MALKTSSGGAFAALLLLLTACRQDMNDQHKLEPMEASTFFADGRGDRPAVAGTVARGQLRTNDAFFAGRVNGKLIAANPLPPSAPILAKGRERYDIFCSVCHDRVGTGQGTIVRRGFKQPPTFHSDRLRDVPDGYIFEIISNGLGAMMNYRDRLAPEERWAVVAYIRALQLSQRAPGNLLTDHDTKQLETADSAAAATVRPESDGHSTAPRAHE